jgi:hypothetical protein
MFGGGNIVKFLSQLNINTDNHLVSHFSVSIFR